MPEKKAENYVNLKHLATEFNKSVFCAFSCLVFFSIGEAILSFGAGEGRGMNEECFSSIAEVQHQPS